MKKPVKSRLRLWVQDLRTTKAPQATGALKVKLPSGKFGYCCLGRACEAYRRATGKGRWRHGQFIIDSAEGINFLPTPVMEWLGVDCDPELQEGNSASQINDNTCADFQQIANLIEKRFELKPSPKGRP